MPPASESNPAPAENAPGASWFPQACWPVAVDHLLEGQDYVVLLDRSLGIIHANQAFAEEISSAWRTVPVCFADMISAGAAKELRSSAAQCGPEGFRLELFHAVAAGTRCVHYAFRPCEEALLAIGRDQTTQLELVTQMASLVNDLEVRVDHEKERSESLQKLSEKDPLTGLANRREFERIFNFHLQLFQERSSTFSVISIDIDRFKQVNDAHGHLLGDEVLKRVAFVLESNLREGDCVARMGGEEFTVLACGATLKNAVELAERLRHAVETSDMPAPLGRVTVSVGVAAADPSTRESLAAVGGLIDLADRALYVAKDSGRNCVRWIEAMAAAASKMQR